MDDSNNPSQEHSESPYSSKRQSADRQYRNNNRTSLDSKNRKSEESNTDADVRGNNEHSDVVDHETDNGPSSGTQQPEQSTSNDSTRPQYGQRQDSTSSNNSAKSPNNRPLSLIAVSFKEAALDSPTFRASMNHISEQFESIDRWLDSFSKAISRLSQEMEGK